MLSENQAFSVEMPWLREMVGAGDGGDTIYSACGEHDLARHAADSSTICTA